MVNKPKYSIIPHWKDLDQLFESKKIHASAQRVFEKLCQFYNLSTGECYPSIVLLCRVTGLHRNTVRGAIKELQKQGLLSAVRRSRRKPFSYTIPLMSELRAVIKSKKSPLDDDPVLEPVKSAAYKELVYEEE